MAVREFDGIDDRITFSPGGLSSFLPGAMTVAYLWKPLSVHAGGLLYVSNSANDSVWQNNPYSDGFIWASSAGGTIQSMAYASTDGWTLAALTRPAGAAQTVRLHKYLYSTTTWSHTNDDETMSDTNNGPATALYVGEFIAGGEHLHARLAVIGVWNVVLSDVQLEGMTASLSSWLSLNPIGLWGFNQASTATNVTDLTSGGANQSAITGTTVVTGDDPPGFNFSLSAPAWTYAFDVVIG